jgi:hypothetical protein
MSKDGRRLWIGSALLLAALVGAVLLRTPEPARTALSLASSLCGERSPREREHEIAEHVAEYLLVDIEDTEAGWLSLRYSRAELFEQLAQFDAARPRCQLQLDDWSIQSAADGSEWLSAELEFSESQAGDLHAERRSLRAQFRSDAARRRLERVRLSAPRRHLPEARP